MVLLAVFHEERLPGEEGRTRPVSNCLYLRQRPEDSADTCLLNKAVMNKAQINPVFKLYQSVTSALYQDCLQGCWASHIDPQLRSAALTLIGTGTY